MADISNLVNSVKGDVVTEDQPSYPAAIARWAKNAERKAKVVVFVKSAEDVAASIAYAKENKLPFAIRGGGHNAASASSVTGGLVVDLSRYLNTVRIDADAKLGYVGGGALWRDVDAEAIKFGLAGVGGTVNHTGVGGLSLGGGFGWLSGRHGMVVDNIRQVTIVTADGSILTANETEHPDLFWGIRGGGSNFGVVTEFVYQLHPQSKTVYAGPVVYTPDKVEKIVELTKTWLSKRTADECMIQAATIQNGFPAFVLFLFYNGSEAEGRQTYKEFLDIEHVFDGAKEIPYEQLNGLQNAMVDHGRCYYLKGTTQKTPNVTSMSDILVKLAQGAQEGHFAPAALHEYFNLDKVNTVSDSVTAFRRGLDPGVLIVLSWDSDVSAEKTDKARAFANEIVEIVARGQDGQASSYSNYETDAAGGSNGDRVIEDSESPASSVEGNSKWPADFDAKAKAGFGPNYPRLQKVKKQYDPELFFNRWYPISPA
ncbi:FAD-binding domain-containing protein [Coprinopsis marcescibilis]|uniref:FAD-binding domain-containing protein n=1 Tax=Coprinopsis marcescibilis TaxID=230819 RepID=A0A5C3LJZ3_COPMA|nr:FAD-binding domain-containing protein [Coprinopsis marcescibilis]